VILLYNVDVAATISLLFSLSFSFDTSTILLLLIVVVVSTTPGVVAAISIIMAVETVAVLLFRLLFLLIVFAADEDRNPVAEAVRVVIGVGGLLWLLL